MEHSNTRINKWKEYREEIEKNISLQKSILASNEKVKIFSKRLKDIFPNYDEKYPKSDENTIGNFKLGKVFSPKLFDTKKSEEILEEILKLESNEEQSLQFIQKFNFSSGELDQLIEEVKTGKSSKIRYVDVQEETNQMKINKIKKIDLSKGAK